MISMKDFEDKFHVFYVTCIKLDLDEKKIIRSRCWGYYCDYKTAESCVLENWTDLFERDYYNYAVIEKCGEGPLGLPYKKMAWFKTSYKYDREGYAKDDPKIEPCEEPPFLKQLVHFCRA